MSNRFKPSDSGSVRSQQVLLIAALLGIGALTAALPGPLTVLQVWQTPAASVGSGLGVIDTALLLAATTACWAVLAWAGVLLLLAVAARLPGGIGRRALTALRRVSPTVLRSALIAGVGASMAGGITLIGSPAQAGAAASPPISAPPAAAVATVATTVPAPAAHSTAGWRDPGTAPPSSAGSAAGNGSRGTAGSASPGTELDPVPLGVDWPVSRPTGTVAAPAPAAPTKNSAAAPETSPAAAPTASTPAPATSTKRVVSTGPAAPADPAASADPTASAEPDQSASTARPAAPAVGSAAPAGRSADAAVDRSGEDGRLDLDWPLGSPPAPSPPAPSAPAPQPSGSRPTQSGVRPAAEPGRPVSEQARQSNGNGAGTDGQQSPGPAPATQPADRASYGGHSGHGGVSRRGKDNGSPASGGGSARAVVVQPGDSLWLIAERALGPQRGSDPAAVDAAWREWYRTNRAVIGADPDLILPGQRLSPPRPD